MKSRWTLILAVVGVVVLAGLAVLLFVGGDDDSDASDDTDSSLPTPPTVPPPVQGDISTEAQELIDLLDRGADGHYHALYAVEGPEATAAGTSTIELWRDGSERSRRDVKLESEEGNADTMTLVDGETAALCERRDGGDWTCTAIDVPEGPSADVVGSIRNQLIGATVTPRDDEIDGREVRCFTFSAVDGPSEICATEEGVVVKLGTEATSLRLTELDEDVPGDVFDPPAEVQPAAEG